MKEHDSNAVKVVLFMFTCSVLIGLFASCEHEITGQTPIGLIVVFLCLTGAVFTYLCLFRHLEG